MSSPDVDTCKSSFSRLKKLSYLDGSFHALMVSIGETLAVLFLSSSKINSVTLGILMTVPTAIGAISQALTPRIFKGVSTRTITLVGCLLQIPGLILMAAALQMQQTNLWLMGLGMSLYWIGGMSTAPSWQDWITGLLPQGTRNSFFASRSAFISLILFACYLAVGFLLQDRITREWVSGLLLVSIVFRLISWVALYLHEKPGVHGLAETLPLLQKDTQTSVSLTGAMLPACERKSTASLWALCLLMFSFRAACSTSGPFYNPYMLSELNLPVPVYSCLNALPLLVRVFFFQNWGRLLDEKRLYEGLFLSILGITLIPILWTASGNVAHLAFLQITSGFVWSGYEFIGVLLIQNLYPNRIMQTLALSMAATSLGNAAGGIIGGFELEMGLSYKQNFAISTVLRAITGGAFLFYLRDIGAFNFRRLELKAGMATVVSLRPSIAAISRLFPVRTETKGIDRKSA